MMRSIEEENRSKSRDSANVEKGNEKLNMAELRE